GVNVTKMRVCGGGSKSPVWQQIMADLYDCEIVTMEKEEGPALGVAILAGAGTGVFKDVREASQRMSVTGKTISPIAENVEIYKKYHALFDSLYEHMKEDFNTLFSL
ncbi:MAG: xylulokinase, partial [Lachnospiraceae bacterium]|nr:xylulokinase [Lachnospiraceae bacterium]